MENSLTKDTNKIAPARIMLAADKSGSGKTSISLGIMSALSKQGKSIASFKCGPDYIDPMYHRYVATYKGNLDSFFVSKEVIENKVADARGDFVLIEGAMGIYDGKDFGSLEGSAYDIAEATGTNIVLIVDGRGAARTLISLLKGILIDDESRLIKGIILNRVSKSTFIRIKNIADAEFEKMGFAARLIGCIPKDDEVSLSSRHLGLNTPDNDEFMHLRIENITRLTEANIDLCSVIEIANTSRREVVRKETEKNCIGECAPLRMAVAYDEAFCFLYEENINVLKSNGIEPVYFSPLRDSSLPDGISAILLPGGYPELYLETLSSNKEMLSSIRDKILNGIPVLAECGGYMYLHSRISDMEGRPYEMAGVIDAECYYTGHLVRFGYICIEGKGMAEMKGHEFHYYETTEDTGICTARKPSGKAEYRCMSDMNGYCGFPHLYYESDASFIPGFRERMRTYALVNCLLK